MFWINGYYRFYCSRSISTYLPPSSSLIPVLGGGPGMIGEPHEILLVAVYFVGHDRDRDLGFKEDPEYVRLRCCREIAYNRGGTSRKKTNPF